MSESTETQSATTNSLLTDTPAPDIAADTGQSAEGTEQPNEETTEPKAEVPEEYADFTMPEGIEVDKSLTDGFKPIAKELGLTQEQAQKLVDYYASGVLAQRQEQWAGVQKGWQESAKVDKEFGGTQFNENMGLAKSALDKFGTPELKQFLDQYGGGNNPEVIRFFYRVGKAMAEPQHVSGAETKSVDAESRIRNLYPNSK